MSRITGYIEDKIKKIEQELEIARAFKDNEKVNRLLQKIIIEEQKIKRIRAL